MYPSSIMDLPAELLVLIISFLGPRDAVKLRYVSKSLRVFTGVPSLWRKLVWPYYDSREEASVIELLQECGKHIRLLSFTNCIVSLKLYLMLMNCASVIDLTLLTEAPLIEYQLEEILQHLKHLKKLAITWSGMKYPVNSVLNSQLAELTLQLPPRPYNLCDIWEHWLMAWMNTGYKPQNVNIVHTTYGQCRYVHREALLSLLKWWSDHFMRKPHRPPTGYVAHFNLYDNYKAPFNLFTTLPRYHIKIGLTLSVRVTESHFNSPEGVTPMFQCCFILKFNHCSCSDHRCKCKIASASADENIISYVRADLRRSGKIIMGGSGVLFQDMQNIIDKDLEQIALLLPNLQAVDLGFYNLCLDNLGGLRAIVDNCQSLKRLNLTSTHVESVDPIVLWEILSGAKLTHLSVEHCHLIASTNADKEQEMIILYQKFQTLQAIEVYLNSRCSVCKNSSGKGLQSLSYFSSLQYCRLPYSNYSCFAISVFWDVFNSCTQLKCLIIHSIGYNSMLSEYFEGLALSEYKINNVEQLFFHASHVIISDEFMKSISAHGKLVHVVLHVSAITKNGIEILIENSPKLIELHIDSSFSNGGDLPALKAVLKQKYCNRKLFTAGYFEITYNTESGLQYFYQYKEQNTVFFPLW